jgi:CrcB protein
MTWLSIALGGAIGSLARYSLNHVVHAQVQSTQFPLGIVIVNLSGCFIIGLIAGLLAAERITLSLPWREFVFVGLLGGFTTFSTFGLDTFVLARTHSAGIGAAAANVGAQVIGGLLTVWIGYAAGSIRH